MAVLAMFPLGSALLPGELLPLQVFEPRYRQLVLDLLADDEREPEFGVTLIERGHEVGGGDQRTGVGTVARVVRIDAIDPERYALLAVGVRRIRVVAWLPDDPYPLADVDDWPDEVDDVAVGDLDVAIAAARQRVLATRRLAVELGALDPAGLDAVAGGSAVDDLDGDVGTGDIGTGAGVVATTYRLVSSAPLGPADRQRLLAAASPLERLRRLVDVLDDVDASLQFRLR